MNQGFDSRAEDVEPLIHDFLERQERTVDAQRMLDAVRSKAGEASYHSAVDGSAVLLRPPSTRVLVGRWKGWGIGLTAAATILVAVVGTFRPIPAQASAARLVRAAQAALSPRMDRQYAVSVELAPGAAERFPVLTKVIPSSSRPRLWTRSDRFWLEPTIPGQAWAYGRDERRHVWIAPAPGVGLVFEPREIPKSIALALDLYSVDLTTLLNRVLIDFDVTTINSADDLPKGMTRIRGIAKPEHPPRLRALSIDVENQTKLIRRVVMTREHLGHPLGEVTFTFQQSGLQGDDRYELSGHLAPDAVIYGPDQRLQRRRELIQFFGSQYTNE